MMSFLSVTPRKLLVLAVLALAVVGIALSSLIAVGQTTGPGDDPTTEPIPVFEFPDSAQSIVLRVLFNSPTDVELVDWEVSDWPAPARVGQPPHISVEVFDDVGGLLEQFNSWHPLWTEDFGDDDQRGTTFETSGEGRFIFPFYPDVGTVEITDIELGQELIQIDAQQIVVDYCRENEGDPGCASVIACAGDVNGDGVVTASDIVATARAIPSVEGDQRWNPDADANGDGVVNVEDLRIVIASFLDPACR